MQNFGSFGSAIPSQGAAIQSAMRGLGTPTLSQSPLQSPVAQGVPPPPSSMPQGGSMMPGMGQPSPTPQQAAPAGPESEERIVLKALTDYLKSLSKARTQSVELPF